LNHQVKFIPVVHLTAMARSDAMKLSLRNKFLFPTLILIIAGLGVATVVSYFNTADTLEKAYVTQVRSTADTTAKQISTWMMDRMVEIQLLAKNNMYGTATMETATMAHKVVSRELKAYRMAKPYYEIFVLSDDDGHIRAASNDKVIGKINIKDRDYFKKAAKGTPNVSPPILSKSTKNPVVSIAMPIYRGENVMGVLVGVLDLATFASQFVDPIKVGKSGYAFLMNKDGRVIAFPDRGQILKLDLSKFKYGQEMLTKKKGLITYEYKGAEMIAAFAPVDAQDWFVVATASRAELLAPAQELGLVNLLIAVVVVLVGALVVFFVARSITGPVNRIIAELNQGSNQVSGAADQVSTASQTLAQGTSEQAASLEETSSALEEMSSMTRQNAEHAGEADGLMRQNSEVMEKAGHSMEDMVASMEEINQASEEISKIVKSIDEIAFQTNLLALNAAVEAARAGEAGAGFAVVADEVRNLAMRAAEAAKSTEDLIAGTVNKVKHGSEILERTNKEYVEVSETGNKVGELVGEIAAASQEQSQGIEQVSKAVTEMDTVTQKNAATAEESASAAEELSAQSSVMLEVVERLAGLVRGGSNGASAAEFYDSLEDKTYQKEKKGIRGLLPWRKNA
jgi:methyl-accepting chemotaxis protein